jgi:alpha-galactosidase
MCYTFLMNRFGFLLAVILAATFLTPRLSSAQTLAPTPPLGWNSWDAYGLTIDEEQFRDNATVLASLEQFGWKYAVIDEGWYMANPAGKSLEQKQYLWNSSGLLIPVPARFPSADNNAGFKPLADWLH